MTNKIKLKPHISFLRKKINFITNAFLSFRKHSKSIKFCINTWQTFIRPLLDYCSSYAFYVTSKERKILETLHRTSLRKMVFLKNYVPSVLVDSLIQYPYNLLPEEFRDVSLKRYQARISSSTSQHLLFTPICGNYLRIPVKEILSEIIACMNFFYRKSHKEEGWDY